MRSAWILVTLSPVLRGPGLPPEGVLQGPFRAVKADSDWDGAPYIEWRDIGEPRTFATKRQALAKAMQLEQQAHFWRLSPEERAAESVRQQIAAEPTVTASALRDRLKARISSARKEAREARRKMAAGVHVSHYSEQLRRVEAVAFEARSYLAFLQAHGAEPAGR